MKPRRWLRSRYTLKTQLTLSFMIASIFALSLSAVLIYSNVLKMLQANSEKSTVQLFRQAEYSIDSFRQEVDKISKTIVINPDVQKLLDDDGASEYERIIEANDVIAFLSEIINNYSFIDSLYIFNEHDQAIEVSAGKGAFTTETSFYDLDTYRLTKRNFPYLTWVGANVPFAQSSSAASAPPLPDIISAARGIKSLNKKAQSGTLVIQLKQSLLSEIYDKLAEDADYEIYILDENSVVISSNVAAQLGQSKTFVSAAMAGRQYGSLNRKDAGQDSRQVVFYRIGDSGWTLVKEIPFADFYRNVNALRTIIAVVFTVGLLLSLLLSSYWIRKITTPIKVLGEKMKEMEKGQLGLTVEHHSRNEFGLLTRQFNLMSRSIAELIAENERIGHEKRTLEIQSLQSQINPHFLYNTLNTIKSMAIVAKADNVADSITALGNVLRPIFRNPSILSAVADEVRFISHYAKIMNIRYGTLIRIDIRIDNDIMECEVLRFMFQPLLENCFIHGLSHRRPTGVIAVRGWNEGEDNLFTVADSGVGMPPERLRQVREKLAMGADAAGEEEEGIGLSNVHRRIRLNFGHAFGIRVDSGPDEGTTVWIRVPKLPKGEMP